MRAGIDRIESRNKTLEVQEKNHERLQLALGALIESLELDEDMVAILQNPRFDEPASFLNILSAAFNLENKIKARHNQRLYERMTAGNGRGEEGKK